MAHTPSKPAKAHIPYRNDSRIGKKTGLAVKRVERTSDGFEPFDRVLKQANSQSPPRRRRNVQEEPFQEDDSSMELDSPINYSTAPRGTTANSARPVSRGSRSEFDDVPSPRKPRSTGHAGPSRLAHALTARELLEQDEGEDDYTGGGDDFEETINVEEQLMSAPEEDPVDEHSEEEAVPSPPKKKPRRSKVPEPVEENSEAEGQEPPPKTPQGRPVEEQSEDEEDVPPPPKKKPRSGPAQTRKKKERRESPEGVRRSNRVPIPPLEYWRGEKYVYGPRVPGEARQVPNITEIVRIPKEPPPIRAGTKRKRSRGGSKARAGSVEEREVIIEVPSSNPEMGWDDDTKLDAVVLDYPDGNPVKRRIAFTAAKFDPKPVAGGQWLFEKIFGDDEFMAAGQLVIPPQSLKPAKGTKDNTYIFYVVEGAVNAVVCQTSIVLTTGGMFMVPRGNTYHIENISDRPAKLFFTQARKVDVADDEFEQHASLQHEGSAATTARSKSAK